MSPLALFTAIQQRATYLFSQKKLIDMPQGGLSCKTRGKTTLTPASQPHELSCDRSLPAQPRKLPQALAHFVSFSTKCVCHA